MSDDTVLKLSQPSTFSDPLTEVLRSGARSLLARAVEAEIAAFLDGHSEARTEEGRRRLVRHGHLPEREIMTGIGPVAVRAPRVRDRTGQGADRIRFSSALLPPYARRSKSLEVLIPVLYLKVGPRKVPLNAQARRILERQPRGGSAFVFPSPLDTSRPRSLDLQLWYRVRVEAGIEDVRLHDLRHTHASHAVMNGVPVPVVSQLLGHKNVRMTLRYAHLGDREIEAAAERVGRSIATIMDLWPVTTRHRSVLP